MASHFEDSMTLRDLVSSLGFRRTSGGAAKRDWIDNSGKPDLELFSWPPDVFAMAATVLRETGAYLQATRPLDYSRVPDKCLPFHLPNWTDQCNLIAEQWRHSYNPKPDDASFAIPEGVVQLLHLIASRAAGDKDTPPLLLLELSRPDPENVDWLPFVQLLCIADMACRGMGLSAPFFSDQESKRADPNASADTADSNNGTHDNNCLLVLEGTNMLCKQMRDRKGGGRNSRFMPSTLCKVVDPSRAIVIPKMRTSQFGVTIRSFSLHLALLNGTDAEPSWSPSSYALLKSSERADRRSFSEEICSQDVQRCGPYNLLLVPWPLSIDAKQFRPLPESVECLGNRPSGRNRMFAFDHDHDARAASKLQSLLEVATERVGHVHGLVLPEMSLTRQAFDEIFPEDSRMMRDLDFVVAGVYEKGTADSPLGQNYAIIQRAYAGKHSYPASVNRLQSKHHRWALGPDQVEQYALSASLSPGATWWEAVDLPRRDVNVFALDAFTAFSALICEDLARPDPVADVIRAAGPNLVICLLLDGPQLKTRWSARYATVLADDPGSSVLTLSSLGMVQRCRLRSSMHTKSRVISLWREPGTSPVELHLPEKADALVVSLASQSGVEWTIDGRDDRAMANTLRLAEVFPVSYPHKVPSDK